MKLNLDEFWSYLQSVFKRIEKGTKHKYRLSPPKVIEELKITFEEMIDLNLRILRNKEARKIQKRVAKAEERNQLKPPQSIEEMHRSKHEAQREAFSLHWEGMSKPQIAKLLGISERTVYRYLKGTWLACAYKEGPEGDLGSSSSFFCEGGFGGINLFW